MVELIEIIKAYKDCRKHKSKSLYRAEFEYDLENNLYKLYEDLKNNRYEIGPSICFAIFEPKIREIWAASFRDRIVHHYIYNKIAPDYIKKFIKDTYSCLPERGTLKGAQAVEKYAKIITQDYTQKAYYIKCDIKNFFVSMDRNVLYNMLDIKDEQLKQLLKQIIYNDLKKNAIKKSPNWKLKKVPSNKSLWNAPDNKGLPIGNLTSQFFSNVYLNKLDQFVKHKLKCKYYCRYVDDFVLMSTNVQELLLWRQKIEDFLLKELKLELHKTKRTTNLVTKGVDFVGFRVKPRRKLIRQKTLKKVFYVTKIYYLNDNRYLDENIEKHIDITNSYLGLMRNVNGFVLRKEICHQNMNLFLNCDNIFTKIYSVKKQQIKQKNLKAA